MSPIYVSTGALGKKNNRCQRQVTFASSCWKSIDKKVMFFCQTITEELSKLHSECPEEHFGLR